MISLIFYRITLYCWLFGLVWFGSTQSFKHFCLEVRLHFKRINSNCINMICLNNNWWTQTHSNCVTNIFLDVSSVFLSSLLMSEMNIVTQAHMKPKCLTKYSTSSSSLNLKVKKINIGDNSITNNRDNNSIINNTNNSIINNQSKNHSSKSKEKSKQRPTQDDIKVRWFWFSWIWFKPVLVELNIF